MHIRANEKAYFNKDRQVFLTNDFNNILKHNNIIIFTDNTIKLSMFLKKYNLYKSNIHIVSNDMLTDFYLLNKAKKIYIGMSTFSWWASYLNKSNNIYISKYMYNFVKKTNIDGWFLHDNISNVLE